MHVDVNGARLWFDIEGSSLVPDGPRMRERPVLLLVHGGPAGYDHSYFKPDFRPLAERAQVIYLDLRDHGRSSRGDPSQWSFEICAADVRAFCDALGVRKPVVLGHSMGGFVAMLYGARHPGHASGLVLLSTMARFDLDRLEEGFRRAAGDDVAALARRDYGGEAVSDDEWARVFAAFGPRVPDEEQLGRRIRNAELGPYGMEQMRALDLLDALPDIACPVLVCCGGLDPVTPVETSREIAAALRPGIGRLEILETAGHFPWLDEPERLTAVLGGFLEDAAG